MSTIVKAVECSLCGKVSPARDPLQTRCTACGLPHDDRDELIAELNKTEGSAAALSGDAAAQVEALKTAMREALPHCRTIKGREILQEALGEGPTAEETPEEEEEAPQHH